MTLCVQPQPKRKCSLSLWHLLTVTFSCLIQILIFSYPKEKNKVGKVHFLYGWTNRNSKITCMNGNWNWIAIQWQLAMISDLWFGTYSTKISLTLLLHMDNENSDVVQTWFWICARLWSRTSRIQILFTTCIICKNTRLRKVLLIRSYTIHILGML